VIVTDGLAIYLERMKIEECFRDVKNLLSLEKLMNKRQEYMEKMVALLLISVVMNLIRVAYWLTEELLAQACPSAFMRIYWVTAA